MNITSIPALLGVFALALLVLLLAKVIVQPAEDKTAKRLLILLLVGLLSMASCLFYIYADMREHWPRLYAIDIGLAWWIGPSLYLYLKRLNGAPSPFASPLTYLHWAPGLLIELILLPFFLMPTPEKLAFFASPSGIYDGSIWLTWWGFHIQVLLYTFFCLPQLRIYKARLLDNFSNTSVHNYRWLQIFCFGLIAEVMVERLFPLLAITSSNVSNIAGTTVYVLVISLAYTALGKSRLYLVDAEQRKSNVAKYRRSGLHDESAEYYLKKLNRLMASERYFLESDLSLNSLAARVNVSAHHLSQILNDKLTKNFYNYINEQRVAYAKERLTAEPERSVTEIAFESGYNNKNSFYNAFKRHTGMTPAEYRRLSVAPDSERIQETAR